MNSDTAAVIVAGLIILMLAAVGGVVWVRSREGTAPGAMTPTAIDDQPPVADTDGRLHSAWRVGISAIGLVTAVAFLVSLASWLPHTLLAPFVAPQHIERLAAGFAISMPLDWEYVDGVHADPEEWWDEEKVRGVHAHHEQFVADGGLMLARTRSPFAFHFCTIYDLTDDAMEPPAWTSLVHVPSDAESWGSGSEKALDVELTFLDLPAGQAVRADVLWDEGWDQSNYYYKQGARWFRLSCGTDETAPEDRWLSIAETFEFLPLFASSAVPDLEPQRIERTEAGFAVTLPWHWHHAKAEDGDPEVWWDAELVGDAGEYHERRRAEGLLLMARAYLTDGPALQFCFVEDFTARAVKPPAWTSVGDAWFDLLPLRENPDVITAEATNLDLPSGRSVRFDVLHDEDFQRSYYYLVDGTTWFVLECQTSGEPPEDDWLSIAETFEFLPKEE